MFEYLGLAFVGGVILNIMPCVLPVLTLKVFHTIEMLGDESHDARLHGLAYAAGTVTAFLAFAIGVAAFRASGETLGWGMHFRHPPFVAALVAVIFAFGLNALGVFEITVSMRDTGKGPGGAAGSYFNGIFAAIMSTPCTAPFLVTAAGFAMAAETSWWQTMVLFAAIGAGLAFPYALVSFVPGVARLLPRPGPWMLAFKHLMGFTLLGTAVWLFGALQAQITPRAANLFLGFLLVMAMGLWAMDRFVSLRHSLLRRLTVRTAVGSVVVLLAFSMVTFERPAGAIPEADDPQEASLPAVIDGHINWIPFSPSRLSRVLASGRPTFVDYTADWCAACKTNETLFLETNAVRSALAETGILPMMADMTNENKVFDEWLDKLGRSGIPAYAIYMPDGSVDLLPIAISSDIVVTRLQAAAKRFPPRIAVIAPTR